MTTRPTASLRPLRRGAPPAGTDFDRLAGAVLDLAEEVER